LFVADMLAFLHVVGMGQDDVFRGDVGSVRAGTAERKSDLCKKIA
jgi:hypothetical protein